MYMFVIQKNTYHDLKAIDDSYNYTWSFTTEQRNCMHKLRYYLRLGEHHEIPDLNAITDIMVKLVSEETLEVLSFHFKTPKDVLGEMDITEPLYLHKTPI